MTMKQVRAQVGLVSAAFLVWTLLGQVATAADGPIRISVLHLYSATVSGTTDDGLASRQVRHISRLIDDSLVRSGFKVVNPFAHMLTEEMNRFLEDQPREEIARAVIELARKAMVDVVYTIRLDVEARITDDAFCQASARVRGEGYDSEANPIGVGISRSFRRTRRNCDGAIDGVIKEMAGELARLLAAALGVRGS